jgi:hypothetical protein
VKPREDDDAVPPALKVLGLPRRAVSLKLLASEAGGVEVRLGKFSAGSEQDDPPGRDGERLVQQSVGVSGLEVLDHVDHLNQIHRAPHEQPLQLQSRRIDRHRARIATSLQVGPVGI